MPEPELNLDDIQGNVLAGFNKDHQCFLFVSFGQAEGAKAWLKELAPEVASSKEVRAFNELFKEVNQRRGAERGTIKATWLNVALSASGLGELGVPAEQQGAFSQAFREGMKARAGTIGDVGANAPEHWQPPLGSTEVHALLLIAADERGDLDAETLRQVERLGDHDLKLLFKQDGKARSDLPGHEHFGFKDGVSQPGIREFTQASQSDPNQGQPGQDLVWPGEFVLGYQTQKGATAPPSPTPNPQPGPYQSGGGGGSEPPPAPIDKKQPVQTAPGPVETQGPAWAKDGSYLVFRRLRQDVAAFESYVEQTAASLQRSSALLGAKLVGRYKSGCPLEKTADEPATTDPQTVDPSLEDPTLLDDDKINDFEYGADPDGGVVPRAAHIRKAYPRDEETDAGGEADTQTHRLLRRGIAYGEPYDPGAPTGSKHAGDAQFPHDRGLLFFCYQSSIENQFELVQSKWANAKDFPNAGDGEDPIIAQASEQRTFEAPGFGQQSLSIPQFVTTTGGEYFFAPSISALTMLAGL